MSPNSTSCIFFAHALTFIHTTEMHYLLELGSLSKNGKNDYIVTIYDFLSWNEGDDGQWYIYMKCSPSSRPAFTVYYNTNCLLFYFHLFSCCTSSLLLSKLWNLFKSDITFCNVAHLFLASLPVVRNRIQIIRQINEMQHFISVQTIMCNILETLKFFNLC